MKHAISFLLCLGLLLSACENKRDDNGDLGGMWQMTLWTNAQGDTLATNQTGIYYHFQLNVMKVQRQHLNYYLMRFAHKGDSLLVGTTFAQPFDSIVSHDKLAPYGVPADGRFRIDALNDNKMQLSGAIGTLQFRKY